MRFQLFTKYLIHYPCVLMIATVHAQMLTECRDKPIKQLRAGLIAQEEFQHGTLLTYRISG